ncbi:MAG: radical SAM family heme chaperone HemW [Candidatus Eremiobacteraeota bacterium]|nr:radical SAM family heme chaperone HemW [Candidatus Eremiobacteraeota bacterium]MBV9263138.1 radical SAM family heme chaperone HemW [Candidatus Eremiobacteraeota bacterium]
MLGIYVHLPFCPYLCPYCDFAKWPLRESSAREYLSALFAEVEHVTPEPAATIYLGGGTPNAYAPDRIEDLLRRLNRGFPGAREITIEVNPELVRDGDLRRYRDAGITRLSIGVQSFVADEIRTLGRKHSAGDVARVVLAARAAGFDDISLDLMFAVPEQTAGSWKRSLDAATALDVDHVSAYGLTVEEGTPYAAWRAREPAAFASDAVEAELYAIAIETLERAGYRQYEISNFARPGHECKHNLNYWANGEYLGLGVGAASYRDGVRSVHTKSLHEYVIAALEGAPIPAQAERLEGHRRTGEALMLALRTSQGVRLGDFKDRYGIDVIETYAPVILQFASTGLLEQVDGTVRLTARGRFLANDVCGAFVTFE